MKKIINIAIAVIIPLAAFSIYWYVTDVRVEEEAESLQPAETFVREGTVIEDPKYNNMDVITLPDGTYRAFFHLANGIFSAISKDGKSFTLEPGARLNGEMPATVRLADDTYRMYYVSGPGGALLSATSVDGFTFTPEEGVRLSVGPAGSLDEAGIIHPSIVALPGGAYKLYYDGVGKQTGENLPWRIMSASSTDGLNWTKDEGARIPVDEGEVDTSERYKFTMAFSAHVEFRDNRFVMYFTSEGEPRSQTGIWRATSTDGLTFVVEIPPILPRDPEDDDGEAENLQGGLAGMPQDPFVLDVPGGRRLFYWTSDGGYQSTFLAE